MAQTLDRPVVAVLRKARELYAANPSHAPVSADVEDGRVCIVTATSNARRDIGADWEAEADADDAIKVASGWSGSILQWNAEHSTAEVLAAFDRAIASVSS